MSPKDRPLKNGGCLANKVPSLETVDEGKERRGRTVSNNFGQEFSPITDIHK